MDEVISFGDWIKQRRQALHLTQDALAQRLRVAFGTLRKWESDERRPSQDLAAVLAEVLEVPLEARPTFVKVARGELALDHLALAPDPTSRPRVAGGRSRSTLPVQRTPVIGRERELAQVRALLLRGDVGLVTLSGPGGTGKTRLALEVAAGMFPSFADGVWFVDLAPIGDPVLLVTTIAGRLGLKETGELPLQEALTTYLQAKELLLVLDNFEQIVAAAPLLTELLSAAPQLKVLVTSREVLRITGEHEYPLAPLALPDLQRLPAPEQLTQYAAVGLFVYRACVVIPEFQVTQENATTVAEICVRLDGLPLAIELAAARIRLLPPHALLQRLSSRLKLLTGGGRDLPARQQTLRGAIAWSYGLLDAPEQHLFARLAVFAGGRTLEAVEAVCNAAGDLEIDVLDGVASLVDKSLLWQEAGAAGEPRFVMLETIQEYAWERLEASGEAEAVQRQHAAYFLQLAETAAPALAGPEQVAWLERLEAEHANLRIALHWALGKEGSLGADVELGMRLAGRLGQFWERRAHLREGRLWLERAVECGRDATAIPAPVQARCLYWLGQLTEGLEGLSASRLHFEASLALFREVGDKQGMAQALFPLGSIVWFEQGDRVAGRALMDESVALFREVGDKPGLANVLISLGLTAFSHDDYTMGHTYIDEGLRLSRELGDTRGIATAFSALGNAAGGREDYATGRAHYEASLALFRELGDTGWVAGQLNNLGYMLALQGDGAAAQVLLEESVALVRAIGHTGGISTYQHSLAMAVLLQGDGARAAGLLKENLALNREMEGKSVFALYLEGLAAVAAAEQQPDRAGQLWGTAAAVRDALDHPLPPYDHRFYERWLAPARANVGDEAWQAAWAEGQAMTLEQAIAYALEEVPDT